MTSSNYECKYKRLLLSAIQNYALPFMLEVSHEHFIDREFIYADLYTSLSPPPPPHFFLQLK